MNNIIQPLRVYSNSDYSFENKMNSNSYIHRPMLLASSTCLIPFTWQRLKTVPNPPTQDDIYSQIAITTVDVIKSDGWTLDALEYLTFEMSYVTQVLGDGSTIEITEQVNYWGDSIIPELTPGIYYISIEDYNGGAWITDKFVVKLSADTVTFEFKHSQNFMNLPYHANYYYKVIMEGITYDTFEVDQIRETYTNRHGDLTDKFLKYYQLKAFQQLMDSNLKAVFDLMRHHDTVYITSETGERKAIRVMDVVSEPVGNSNQGGVIVKYEEVNDRINSTTENMTALIYTQTGVDFVDQSGLNIGGTQITIGGTSITIGS